MSIIKKPSVVIDGCNVILHWGRCHTPLDLSRGIKLLAHIITQFETHTIHLILKRIMMKKTDMTTQIIKYLLLLLAKDHYDINVILVNAQGDSEADDRAALIFAYYNHCPIISNDRYRSFTTNNFLTPIVYKSTHITTPDPLLVFSEHTTNEIRLWFDPTPYLITFTA